MSLSQKDVERLLKDPSTATRQEVLAKIAHQYNTVEDKPLSSDETKIVEDIFRALARSAEVEIRKTLAESIKNSPNLPKDIALQMANDIADVSHPILKHSPVFNEKDLLDIIETTQDAGRALAIAHRDNLSEALTSKLIDQNDEQVITTVLTSFGSVINDMSYDKIIENQPLSEQVVNAILEKGSLSVAITQKLLSRVTGKIRQALDEKYQVVFESKHLKKEMEKNLRSATADIAGLRSVDAHNKKMIDDLDASGKLTPFTALSVGNYQMFEVTLSRLAHVPLNNVRILIYDHGEPGLKRLCKKAGIPDNLIDVIVIAVRALQSFEGEFMNKPKPILKPKDIIDRIKLLNGDKKIDHLDFFISLMKFGAH